MGGVGLLLEVGGASDATESHPTVSAGVPLAEGQTDGRPAFAGVLLVTGNPLPFPVF